MSVKVTQVYVRGVAYPLDELARLPMRSDDLELILQSIEARWRQS